MGIACSKFHPEEAYSEVGPILFNRANSQESVLGITAMTLIQTFFIINNIYILMSISQFIVLRVDWWNKVVSLSDWLTVNYFYLVGIVQILAWPKYEWNGLLTQPPPSPTQTFCPSTMQMEVKQFQRTIFPHLFIISPCSCIIYRAFYHYTVYRLKIPPELWR